jgi:orotidine-5'-phosphate decarboxylase
MPYVLPSVSRELLEAGPDLAALQDAADRLNDACRGAVEGGRAGEA